MKSNPIIRTYKDDGAGNTYYEYFILMSYYCLQAYTVVTAGAHTDTGFYSLSGQIKERIDSILLMGSLYNNIPQYVDLDCQFGDSVFTQTIINKYYSGLMTENIGYFDYIIQYEPGSPIYPYFCRNLEEAFAFWFLYYSNDPNRGNRNFIPSVIESEEYDDEELEEGIDDEEIDESYSEQLWALEPGYYMSYFANLGFIVPNRYVIDVDISSRIWKYGYIVIYQIELPLEQQWIPEAVGLVAMALAFGMKLLPKANNGVITSLDITRLETGKYMARMYPSKKLVDLKDILGKGETLTAFDFGNLPSPINPMLYYAASHIESIINKVLSVFTTVYLLPMNEYVGFNREDSVPVPQPEQIEQIKYMVSGYLRSKNLFSFNKIEIYNKDYVESLNLGTADNIMVFNERDPAINSFRELMKELNKFVKIEPFEAMIDDWNRQQRLNNGKTNTMAYFRRKWEMLAMKPAPGEALQNKLISEWLNRYEFQGVV